MNTIRNKQGIGSHAKMKVTGREITYSALNARGRGRNVCNLFQTTVLKHIVRLGFNYMVCVVFFWMQEKIPTHIMLSQFCLSTYLHGVDHSVRAVLDTNCLRPLDHWIVNLNPTRGMEVCVRLVSGWSSIQGVWQNVYRITEIKKATRAQ
jgi:hypothetical protein